MRWNPKVIHRPCDGCETFIRTAFADRGINIDVYMTRPADPGPYVEEFGAFICPHGRRYWPVPGATD